MQCRNTLAQRDGKRFVVRSEEKLTAFGELEAEISHAQASAEQVAARQARPYKLRSNSATAQSSLFSAPTTSQNASAVTPPSPSVAASCFGRSYGSLKSPACSCVSITLPASS
jgi:hypothetical protein